MTINQVTSWIMLVVDARSQSSWTSKADLKDLVHKDLVHRECGDYPRTCCKNSGPRRGR